MTTTTLMAAAGTRRNMGPSEGATFLKFKPLSEASLRTISPCVYVIVLLLMDVGFWRQDQMYASEMACVVVAMLIFQILLDRLPITFHALWIENVNMPRESTPATNEGPAKKSEHSPDNSTSPQNKDLIVAFMKKLEGELNSRFQWIPGGLAVVVPVYWRWITYKNNGKFLTACPFDSLDNHLILARSVGIIALFTESAIAVLIGLLLWRLLVAGSAISNACGELKLVPKVRHPDGSAGFKPLGQLCFMMALVFTIAGIFLSFWLVFGNAHFAAKYHGWYTSLFEVLLVVPIAGAVVSFVLPLWNVHKVMVDASNSRLQDLDRLGQKISDLEISILQLSSAGAFDESQEMLKHVKLLKGIYKDNNRLPVWPFDIRTSATFLATQTIPAITLLESLFKVVHG